MKNWAGNYTYRARRLLEPRSVEELRSMVARTDLVRAAGARYSFNGLGDSDGDLVTLRGLPRVLQLHEANATITVDTGARYGDVCPPLHASGYALENLPSLPHITVGGACATGTHGSGDHKHVLAASVTSLDLVLADGKMASVDAGTDIPLAGAAVSLGALGVVTGVTLRVEPTYDVQQEVFEGLSLSRFAEAFAAATAIADSASFFTDWHGTTVDQVWVKRRVPPGVRLPPVEDIGDARPATRALHPIRGMPADACTPQLGIPGPWHERLPHFRLSHTPSSGDELQSEYFVDRADALAALHALDDCRTAFAPLVQVSEIRTIAADDLWLSPAHGRPTVAFHFTWRPDQTGVLAALDSVEAALAPFSARPHWAKLSSIPVADLAAMYPRLADFARLARRLDPGAKFSNPWLATLLAAAGS